MTVLTDKSLSGPLSSAGVGEREGPESYRVQNQTERAPRAEPLSLGPRVPGLCGCCRAHSTALSLGEEGGTQGALGGLYAQVEAVIPLFVAAT